MNKNHNCTDTNQQLCQHGMVVDKILPTRTACYAQHFMFLLEYLFQAVLSSLVHTEGTYCAHMAWQQPVHLVLIVLISLLKVWFLLVFLFCWFILFWIIWYWRGSLPFTIICIITSHTCIINCTFQLWRCSQPKCNQIFFIIVCLLFGYQCYHHCGFFIFGFCCSCHCSFCCNCSPVTQSSHGDKRLEIQHKTTTAVSYNSSKQFHVADTIQFCTLYYYNITCIF